ncbi:MAG: class I SAM-dependent methyltransferase [Pseudomonadota bacterium]
MVDRIVDGIARLGDLNGKRILDLGCGPGLYAQRLSQRGAAVHGVDFSTNSIAYAKEHAPGIRFSVANYLADDLGEGAYDYATLIYGDICALAPSSRRRLFEKVGAALRPGGRFILDAFSRPQFDALQSETVIERDLMDGFWAATDYVGVKQTLLYSDEAIALDRYTIVEPDRHWVVHNWLKYFEPRELIAELEAAGFLAEGSAQTEDWNGRWAGEAAPFFLVASLP